MYDVKNLSKMKNLEALAPEAMRAFVAFDKAAVADGAIPGKYKELIALGVAFTTQCPYCIEIHANNARKLARRIRRSPKPSSSPRRCVRVGRLPTVRMR
jgi:AhpD family alkylhydroperoxidase